MKSHDVEQIEAVGKKFDPLLHQAITQRAEDDKEDNIVLEENQRGYKLGGRVIRPSKVIVNKTPALKGQQGTYSPVRKIRKGSNLKGKTINRMKRRMWSENYAYL